MVNSFNSRTPGGVRLAAASSAMACACVSIHAPREGCDALADVGITALIDVSIHAPREGCDALERVLGSLSMRFNSRTPGGVRLQWPSIKYVQNGFNSRTPGGVRRV